MNTFKFTVRSRDQKTLARAGEITTPHGVIETPAFVPVGTQATVKSLTPEELQVLQVKLFFVNTYHTYLRPGIEIIKKIGGLHKFMNWHDPLITDSGGFQVFSLGSKRLVNLAISESSVLDQARFTKKLENAKAEKTQVFPDDYRPVGQLVTIDDEGVTFTSHWDGVKHRFTPELSMQLQFALGADIHIAFDECSPYPTTEEYAHQAMERTHAWATRSLHEHRKLQIREQKLGKAYQALYGVVQGSVYQELRIESANFIAAQNFDGIAIGGVAVGESKKEMRNVCDLVVPRLPKHLPRHLLGVGEIDDIFDLIERGIDTFDCVQPTRLARMGQLLIHRNLSGFTLDITKKAQAASFLPIDEKCSCYTCTNFTRAYLHHLFRVRELLGYRLATIHNLHFVVDLTRQIRAHIMDHTFGEFKRAYLAGNQGLDK
ncbi:MAG: Queuine tRNA-ribosyltransferase [Candidatus Gottesmanbacteria bacterium GW2011_GWA1_43_11]|uniref:Queuine tRNA-ribosyltransferase n=1 Tax=Candidatus Gottesmanbacteria bacterium GW2011_GWA1_43_11 TaxID=1618436 RepID=A0A0G1FEP5_9BACT|nr:MAG: Queuine tRNA-ribosyltransferase [Candidatus Gottesmanbacteria bacterium GW2011_GWA1_43_11]